MPWGILPIRRFNKYAIEAEANGKKVYHLNIGQPDVETPACFMEAVKDFDKKVVAYSESGGETVLQDAICRYFERYDIHYDRSEILVTNGGSEALNMVFTAVINPGEEAIIAGTVLHQLSHVHHSGRRQGRSSDHKGGRRL